MSHAGALDESSMCATRLTGWVIGVPSWMSHWGALNSVNESLGCPRWVIHVHNETYWMRLTGWVFGVPSWMSHSGALNSVDESLGCSRWVICVRVIGVPSWMSHSGALDESYMCATRLTGWVIRVPSWMNRLGALNSVNESFGCPRWVIHVRNETYWTARPYESCKNM